MFYSGGISGAITDPDSPYATEKAYELYDEIRKRSTDVEKIYYNIRGELTLKELRTIKNYLFIDEHDLPDGRHCRFDPAFDIAQSWMRLANGAYAYHDLVLLLHEKSEMNIINLGFDQGIAHDMTNKKYNYHELSKEFYRKLDQGKSVTEIVEEERNIIYGRNEKYYRSR